MEEIESSPGNMIHPDLGKLSGCPAKTGTLGKASVTYSQNGQCGIQGVAEALPSDFTAQ